MSERLPNSLRLYRLRSGFSQRDLAFLLGYRAGSVITRLERQQRRIALASAFAYHLIFGEDARETFPALYERIEEGVITRMQDLYARLEQDRPSRKTAIKLQNLEKALRRTHKEPKILNV
jgi:transcriptional regulator with XRE-family HTH domain